MPLKEVGLHHNLVSIISLFPENLVLPLTTILITISPYRLIVAWVLAFWLWRAPAHGYWIDVDGLPDDFNREGQKPSWYEKIIISLARGSDARALYWRYLFVLPGVVLVWLCGGNGWLIIFSPIFAALCADSYVVAKFIQEPEDHIPLAEKLNGALWGLLIIGFS